MTGYRQAYAAYLCAMEGHVVIVNSTSTAPQSFPGGVCTRCYQYVPPWRRSGWVAASGRAGGEGNP